MVSEFRRVATPEGLRRLTSASNFRIRTRLYASGRVPEDSAGSHSMSGTGSIDLEAGRREDGGVYPVLGIVQKAVKVVLSRCYSCSGGAACGGNRRRWTGLVMTLQTVVIVALVLRIRRDAGGGRAEGAIERPTFSAHIGPLGHIGPRVAFVKDQAATELDHLIMVPGHGVTVTESLDGADSRDGDWFLLDYQKGKDVPSALVGHIRGGLDELDADKAALLLFSGGKTRALAGPKSEGESYFFVADHYDWWGKPDLRSRALTEDFARDSFENILFSICRFKEITGKYPVKITIVGYDFKQDRFENLHRAALRFPPEAFRYVGLHPGGRFDHEAALAGELASAIQPYRLDPYGCAADGPLVSKRAERDPFHRTPPYSLVCPEMRGLLEWCGSDYFEGDLPWSPV